MPSYVAQIIAGYAAPRGATIALPEGKDAHHDYPLFVLNTDKVVYEYFERHQFEPDLICTDDQWEAFCGGGQSIIDTNDVAMQLTDFLDAFVHECEECGVTEAECKSNPNFYGEFDTGYITTYTPTGRVLCPCCIPEVCVSFRLFCVHCLYALFRTLRRKRTRRRKAPPLLLKRCVVLISLSFLTLLCVGR